MDQPPSTSMVCPVIQAEAGDTSQTIASTMSSGVPHLPCGCAFATAAWAAGSA